MNNLQSIQLFGVKVTTDSEENILKYIAEILDRGGKKVFITTPNPEIIMYAQTHPSFRSILNEADLALPDGIGVTMAAGLTGKGKVVRIAGVDFVEKLSDKLAKSPYSIGLFGGVASVAEMAAECLQKKYSGLIVSYAADTWDLKKIMGKKVDVLFVAMGFPKQEEWIYKNLDSLPVTIVMGVGGSFDFISGRVNRAPTFLRMIGLEWLFRLIRQPWRARRQLALLRFFFLTLKETLKQSSLKA